MTSASKAGQWSAPVESEVKWQFWEGKAWTTRTAPARRHVIAIALRAQRDGDPANWLAEATAALAPRALQQANGDEAKLWGEFWSRSAIVINPGAKPNDAGWQVGRNYQLFRYMLACNRGGSLSLLFNGGIFTTDNPPGRITKNSNPELPISNAR